MLRLMSFNKDSQNWLQQYIHKGPYLLTLFNFNPSMDK